MLPFNRLIPLAVCLAIAALPSHAARLVSKPKPVPQLGPVYQEEDTDITDPNVVPELKSNAFLVLDVQTGRPVIQKNSTQISQIASITKLMTAVVLLDAKLPLGEPIQIEEADVDTLRHSSSHLPVGTIATREDLLRLALMSSENRAAAALARTYPGGTKAFVSRMNRKARSLGMRRTRFADSSGLSNGNVSTAEDLAQLVTAAARRYPLIRAFTTTPKYDFVPINGNPRQYGNTDPLVASGEWEIDLSKTGFTNEAGRCLVMKTYIIGRPYILVLLDSQGKHTRLGDANRVRKWLTLKANR